MRAKSEIMESLTSKMSSSEVWKKLKNGLLGRELLALGAEIISESENVKDTMLLQLNPETADKYGLFLLAQMNEIAITNKKPSSVVVEMLPNTKTYAPFELVYNCGNVAFTNIEYTMEEKTVSLLNGTHKCFAENMARSADSVPGGEKTYFYDGNEQYYGIKIGNAYPDSISMCDKDGVEIQRYSAEIALADYIKVMYKVVTGVDGDIYIRFIHAEDEPEPTSYRIDWLDHDDRDFDIDDENIMDGNTIIASIKYVSKGAVDDLTFMRLQLKKEMAKYNGFNTPTSVEQYVRGLPYVLDAKCEKNTDGINIYIKPSSYLDLRTYLDFSEVAAHISLNSILFPNIKIKTGNQIKFGIEISGITDVKLQNGIKALLQDKFSYDKMTFNTVINTGNILSEIYAKYGVVPTINMTIQEPFIQDKPLSFKPIKNTLKLYDNNNAVAAWEENGLLFGKASRINDIPFDKYRVVGSMGTMFLLMLEGTYDDTKVYTQKYIRYGGENEPEEEEQEQQEQQEQQEPEEETSEQYDTYSTAITYDEYSKKFNKFYLYDVSTNTIKPFDGSLQNLLFADTNSNLRYNAWNTDDKVFGNLYDVKFLSTNNSLAMLMIYNNAGTLTDDEGYFKYWRDDNLNLYEQYLTGEYVDYEIEEKYKGKYETAFFVKNPLAFQNSNIDSWKLFEDCVHGDDSQKNGFYTGLRNFTNNGVLLNVKSNWFVHNNKAYYVYEIDTNKGQIAITNGVKNLAVKMNGTFLGMIPYENDLYVFNEKYVTKIIGFEGLKEKEEIYQIYKDYNTPLTITEIIREFDNQIVFHTATNEYYTATGFTVLGGNKMGFENLKRVFDDITIETDCKIGGCTKDYVTAYREVTNDDDTEGVVYYCYDISNGVTKSYNKSANTDETVTIVTEPPEGYNESETTYNLAEFMTETNLDNLDTTIYNTFSSQLYIPMLRDKWIFVELEDEDLKRVVLVKGGSGLYLYYMDNSFNFYPVFVKKGKSCETYYRICTTSRTDTNGWYKWKWDGETKIETHYSQGFYKQALGILYSLINKRRSEGGLRGNGETAEIIINGTRKTEENSQVYMRSYALYADDISAAKGEYNAQIFKIYASENTLTKEFAETKASPTNPADDDFSRLASYMTSWLGNNLFTQTGSSPCAGTITFNGVTSAIGAIYSPDNGDFKSFHRDTDWDDFEVTMFRVTVGYKRRKITETKTPNFSSTVETQELVNIGYYDETKNACVNDVGSEIVYMKYNTQNPNIASNSYLVLDENEIKFV